MKKILITGAQGLLGSNFVQAASKNFFITATYYKNSDITSYKNVTYQKLDLRSKDAVQGTIKKFKPDVIIHAASIGNVDECEKNKEDAYQTNVIGTKHLVVYAKKIKSKFIFLSTNAVFDGLNAPYSEKDRPNPINYYGKTKYEAEKFIGDNLHDFTILRLNTMYGWHKKKERENPATWILSRLKNREKTFVVDDVFNNHLYVKSASDALIRAINKWSVGETYHIAGANCVSRYVLFVKIAEVFGYKKNLLIPVKSSFFDNIAPRPKNTCFELKKMKSTLKLKAWTIMEGISDMKKKQIGYEKVNS